jgi:CheY-like chemotaxis protein
VDDEAEVRVTVGAFLRNAGYVMTNVTNGEDAVIKLPTGERFDLMITDDAMPGANGFAVLDRASYCPILPSPWKDSTHTLIPIQNVAM